MGKNKELLQTLILTIFVIIIGFIGLGNPILILTYPILLTLIGIKHGARKAKVSFIASLFAIGIATQNIFALTVPLQYGILAIVTTYLINKKYSANKIAFYCATLVFLMVLADIGLRWQVMGIDTFNEMQNSLDIMTTEQLKTLDLEQMSESDRSLIVNLTKGAKDYIITITPVLFMISSAAIGYINYYISTRLARLSGRRDIEVPKFSKIIMPTHSILGLGTLVALSYLLKYIGYSQYQQLLDNIFALMFMLCLINGVSLTVYLVNKMKAGKFIKIFLISIIFLSSFFNIVIFSMGIMDIISDFRKLRKGEVEL